MNDRNRTLHRFVKPTCTVAAALAPDNSWPAPRRSAQRRCCPAKMPRPQAAPAKLIDTHHHFYPPAYQKAWADWEDQRKIPHFGVQSSWTRDNDIEAMDKNGITTACCRCASTPGVWFDGGAEHGARHGAAVLRFRRRDGARQSRPLRPVRAAVDARHRRDAERDRIRLRYAARPTASTCKPITATSGSAIRPTSRCWRSSTAARPWSTCIRWSRAAAAVSASAPFRR